MSKPEKHSSLFNSRITNACQARLKELGVNVSYNRKLQYYELDRNAWNTLNNKSKNAVAALLVDEMKEWLTTLLAKNPMKRKEVRHLARKEGINLRLVSRAQRSLGILSYTEGRQRYWKLDDGKDSTVTGEAYVEVDCDADELPW